VHAPASGTVTKVWNDDKNGGGLTVQMQLPGGYSASFNHLSAANYEAGQKITVGQVLGLTGKDGSGQGVTQYSVADADGQLVDPRTASSAPIDPASFHTAEDEEKAISYLNANVADPDMQKLAEGYVRGIANTNRQVVNREHSDALQQATDWYLQHGRSLDGLPADTMMRLTPEDVDSFSQATKAILLLASWIQNPAAQTVNAVKQAYAQGRLSDNGYLTALRGAMSLSADAGSTDPEKVLGAKVDSNQLDAALLENGFPNLVNFDSIKDPKSRDAAKDEKIQLVQNVTDQIYTAQRESGKALSRDQKQQIIDQTLMNRATVPNSPGVGAFVSTFFPLGYRAGDQQSPLLGMPAQQMQRAYVTVNGRNVTLASIPASERAQAITALQKRNMPVTEQAIADLWVKAGMRGGTTVSAR
jgi:hypothetical protein